MLFDIAGLPIYAKLLRKETMADLAALQKALGISFSDLSLLEQALIHSSYINENPGLAPTSNERLEFLGDAVLGLAVAERLYQGFPRFTEGQMTRLRAALVRRETLARMAQAIGLGDHLYLGKGEEASGGRQKPVNLAGAIEAVIGAIFVDQGLARAQDFTLRLLETKLRKAVTRRDAIDYKSELQELIQATEQQAPTYHIINSTGPDHDKRFTVEVRVGDALLGQGSGKSKKTAESEAARAALVKLNRHY